MSVPPRVVIAAGGTGGHFYPGLVLAQTLKQRGWQPLLLVRAGDPALPRLEAEGIPAATLDLKGFPRRPGPGWASFPWKLAGAWRLAGRILRDFEPRVVVGMGGYLTFPAVLAARLRGVPCAVHESNTVLGLANRASTALGAALWRGLPTARADDISGLLTGTPVRPAFWTGTDAASARRELGLDPGRPTVLVFGGSQGARGLNESVPAALGQAARSAPGQLQVLHLAGSKSTDAVSSAYAAAGSGLRVKVLPYLDAMEKGYGAADLVICRAGASTIAELAALRMPAVLVPYPHATGRHQDANARLLAEAGAARAVPEADLDSRLAAELSDLLTSVSARQRRQDMSNAYDRLQLPRAEQAVRNLADAVERLSRP